MHTAPAREYRHAKRCLVSRIVGSGRQGADENGVVRLMCGAKLPAAEHPCSLTREFITVRVEAVRNEKEDSMTA